MSYKMLRCAHISDLHFSKPNWNPSQLLSKRWLGNLNLLFLRKRVYIPENLYPLIDLFIEKKVDCVFVTGDLSSTSLAEEFVAAQNFIAALKTAGLKVFTLPGNHDNYTKGSYREQRFYQFFDERFSEDLPFDLRTHRVTATRLNPNWWFVGLDTTLATSLISSCGLFSEELETHLRKALASIPSDQSILLANHYPFFCNDSPRKTLKRGKHLKELIEEFPNIRFYLHGHTHRHCIADLRASGLPFVLDSGSVAHQSRGSWNLIDLSKDGCTIESFHKNPEDSSWRRSIPQTHHWQAL